MKRLNAGQIEALRKFDTPTISNAIERFNLRKRTEGFMLPTVKKVLLKDDKPMVGYACTAKISAENPPTDGQKELLFDYYQHIIDTEGPKISVIQDVDDRPIGSFWGEVQATIHVTLGVSGVITNGGVRDLDEVADLGFSYFASEVLVSHGYIHVEQVAQPVTFAGLTVKPGDLLHADKHGVCLIPNEIAHELAAACELTADAERPMLDGCTNAPKGSVTVDDLRLWRKEMEMLRQAK
jgi:4-hydroxy-4-methyl-2-oxoglutarate aldolase